MRPTEAHVRPDALAANVSRLRAVSPDARFCAVVKADGYGHGASMAATAALRAGASWLATATLDEAGAVWSGGIAPEVPILVLGELDRDELPEALALARSCSLRLTVGSEQGARHLVELAPAAGSVPVHLKVDTGMHRLGVDPAEAPIVASMLADGAGIEFEAIWTHLAVADDPADRFTDEQLRRFDEVLAELGPRKLLPHLVHAANSAGLIAHPSSHHGLVRAGIAIYGVDPDPGLAGRVDLDPVLTLRSRVVAVRTVEPDEGVSYGRRWRAREATRVATIPIGYADGVRRNSPAAGIEVLVRGIRRAMLGVVTMDQLMIDAGDDVVVGDDVVLIGSQGSEVISANEIAGRLGTIGYEVLTSISPRVPRRVVD